MRNLFVPLILGATLLTFSVPPAIANTYSSYVASYSRHKSQDNSHIRDFIQYSMRHLPESVLSYYGRSPVRRHLVQAYYFDLSMNKFWLSHMVDMVYEDLQFEDNLRPSTIQRIFIQKLMTEQYEQHSTGLRKLDIDEVYTFFRNEYELMTYLKENDCDICRLENSGFHSYEKSIGFYEQKNDEYIRKILKVQKHRILASITRSNNYTHLNSQDVERLSKQLERDLENTYTARQKRWVEQDDNIIGSKRSYRAYCERRITALKVALEKHKDDAKYYAFICEVFFK